MLERARCCGSLLILIEKLALKAGSSKQGKAILAAVGSNCVEASTLNDGMGNKARQSVRDPKVGNCFVWETDSSCSGFSPGSVLRLYS